MSSPIFNLRTAYDNERLVAEVANSVYAIRNQVTPRGVRQLWNRLSTFIGVSLKSHKGVLLPGLGTFVVGQALEDRYAAYKRYRATFTLLDGRFGGVSQEKSKYRLLSRCPVAQLNYQTVAHDGQLHRSIAQRIAAEMLQRIAVHVVAGHNLKVDFPTVGQLVKNRAGRLEFIFDPALVEALELGVRPETPAYNAAREAAAIVGSRPVSRPAPAPVAAAGLGARISPVAAAAAAAAAPPVQSAAEAGPYQRGGEQAGHNSYTDALQYLLKQCRQADRIRSGAVSRLELEQWLQKDCRELLQAVDGATMLDLLALHTYGTTGRFVQYLSFIQDLEKVVTSRLDPALQQRPGEAAGAAAAAGGLPAWLSPAASPEPSRPPPGHVEVSSEAVGSAAEPQPPSAVQAVEPYMYFHQQQQAPLEQEEQQVRGVGQRPSSPQGEVLVDVPQGELSDDLAAEGAVQQLQDQDVALWPAVHAEQRPTSPVPLNHYLQNMISPRSRLEYDDFNRFHFSQLRHARNKRAVTPKVGEDPLNREEVSKLRAEMRSPQAREEIVARARSPQVAWPSNKIDRVANILGDDMGYEQQGQAQVLQLGSERDLPSPVGLVDEGSRAGQPWLSSYQGRHPFLPQDHIGAQRLL